MWSAEVFSFNITGAWLKVLSLSLHKEMADTLQEAYSKGNTQRELHKVCAAQKGKVGHLSREEKGWGERRWVCAASVFLSAYPVQIMALESLPDTSL